LNRPDDAAAAYQKALEIEPTSGTYTNLGNLRFDQGRYRDAVMAFEKARELNATRYVTWGNLGDAYRWSPGERPKAAEAYRKAIELAQDQVGKSKNTPTQIALYMAKSGDTQGALRYLAAIPAENFDARAYYRAAVIQELGGHRDAALDSLRKALAGGIQSSEINNDPELLDLRNDIRYQRLTVPSASVTTGK
jgi:serine/threonine-protein kinase